VTIWGPNPPTHDANVYSAEPAVAHNTDMLMPRRGTGPQRAFLQFDLSAVPGGATIVSATLKLQQVWYALSSNGPKLLECRNLLGTFTEAAVTWNNMPGLGALVSPSNFDDSSAIGTPRLWDVAALVTQYRGASMPLVVKFLSADEATADSIWGYASKEHATTGARPALTIEYAEGGGSSSPHREPLGPRRRLVNRGV